MCYNRQLFVIRVIKYISKYTYPVSAQYMLSICPVYIQAMPKYDQYIPISVQYCQYYNGEDLDRDAKTKS